MLVVVDRLPQSELNWPENLPQSTPFLHADEAKQGAGSRVQREEAPQPPEGEEQWVTIFSAFPEGVEVVSICTPNGYHAPQAIAALRLGYHVVVEKPLALTVPDARAIVDAARTADRHVFGVMQNRYSPASAWLKEQLDIGILGDLYQVHVNCFWNRDERYYFKALPDGTRQAHPWHGDAVLDGGVLYTQFAHFIDLLCWGFGTPTVEAARFANYAHGDTHRFPDSGTVLLTLPGNVQASLNFSTAIYDQNFESTLTVIAERGTIKLGGQYMNELRYCHVAGLAVPTLPASQPGNDYGGYRGSAANHHFVVDNVVDVLRGRGAVACTAAEGLAVVEVIGRIYAAAKRGADNN